MILIIGGGSKLLGLVVKDGQIPKPIHSVGIVSASGKNENLSVLLKEFLGFSQPATYLVVLMNKGEIRPLGGFWGSFAKIKISSGQLKDMEIHDAYRLPSIKKEYFCDSTLKNVGFSECISFVDSTRVGFTDYDGKVIKSLYEKTFSGEQLKGVIFLRSDLFNALIPNYTEYHLMREFWNASSKMLDVRPNKNKYRMFINAFVGSYQKKLIKRALKQFVDNPEIFLNKVYVYIPDLDLNITKRERPYMDSGFYYFDTDRSFTKGWLFVDRKIYLWEDEVLKYVGEGGYLGNYTGKNIHLKVIYRYDFEAQKRAVLFFDKLEKSMGVALSDEVKYILGYYSFIKSLAQFYYPKNYSLIKSSFGEINDGAWRSSNVIYFLRDYEFSEDKREFVVDFWLREKNFLK